MQYHLDTIPVWEAMEQESGCPLCYLYRKIEAEEVERSLGGSVMEPDTRIKVNETGICAKHHQQLFMLQNRLGHALLTDSHTKELLKKLDKWEKQADSIGGRGLFGKSSNGQELVEALQKASDGCVVCEAIDSHMKRYLFTFIHLWKTDKAFRAKWESSKGVCMPHGAALLTMAQRELSGDNLKQFTKSILHSIRESLSADEKDLEWFTLKFDYRNQAKPWGNSRNALERTINRLRGLCIQSKEDSSNS
ncbi:MAG: DUF6062 family protein [Eubacteriales bacterium]|nr:DUF6062 family protein [Eubacteriales bacterium]